MYFKKKFTLIQETIKRLCKRKSNGLCKTEKIYFI